MNYDYIYEKVIQIEFPIIEERDHYLNCDGEYDRYSYVIVEKIKFEYDVEA